jgi:hypothetical protein
MNRFYESLDRAVMLLIGRTITVCLLLPLCLVLLASQKVHGQTPRVLADEIRDFEIVVGGKPTGKSQIRITETADGVTVVSTDVTVKFDFILYVYRYELRSKETWQGNRLAWVDNRATDAGKKLVVRAKVDSQGSIIEVNGKAAKKGPVLEMTTNFWRCPDAVGRGSLSFMDVDQGTVLAAKLEYVGPDQITIAGNKLPCSHYRLRGGVEADLWFDGQRRLVRQRTVEQGFSTEIRLARLTTHAMPVAAAPTAVEAR